MWQSLGSISWWFWCRAPVFGKSRTNHIRTDALMAWPLAPSTCRVDWWIQPITIGTITIAAARLKVPLYLGNAPPLPSTPRDLCWLDTGAPLSVVPFHVHFHRVRWQPITGISASWAGQSCDLGYVDV